VGTRKLAACVLMALGCVVFFATTIYCCLLKGRKAKESGFGSGGVWMAVPRGPSGAIGTGPDGSMVKLGEVSEKTKATRRSKGWPETFPVLCNLLFKPIYYPKCRVDTSINIRSICLTQFGGSSVALERLFDFR